MNQPKLHGLGACAALGAAAALLVACSGVGGEMPPSTGTAANTAASATSTAPAGNAASAPDAIFGDWHEDFNASTADRQVFVPSSIPLGPAHYRRKLHFGRDGSFSTLRLDPADAHYDCPGTFSAVTANELSAQCKDPKSGETIQFSIHILKASNDRLEVKIKP